MKNVRVNRVAPTLPNGKNIENQLFSFFAELAFWEQRINLQLMVISFTPLRTLKEKHQVVTY